jgi:hypothetical protein
MLLYDESRYDVDGYGGGGVERVECVVELKKNREALLSAEVGMLRCLWEPNKSDVMSTVL